VDGGLIFLLKKYNMQFSFSQKIALFNQNSQVLILKANSTRKEAPEEFRGRWDFPGGGLRIDESFKDGLKRELKEEIGDISYSLGKLVTVWDWQHYSFEYKDNVRTICVLYEAKYKKGSVKISPEHEDFAWEKIENLLKLKFTWADPEVKLIKQLQKIYG
jgi:8-oxo-dGTP pyrophosphatase MutT (NUDIX family)